MNLKQGQGLASYFSIDIKNWREHLTRSGDALPLILSVIVGLITGLGAYIFILLLHQATEWMHFMRDEFGLAVGIAVMIGAGIVTGLIIDRFAKEAKGHGVPEVMEAIALRRGHIRPQVAVAKIIASTITIGAGGSAGREGPIVQVGSALGSTIGQWAKLSDDQIRMLVASGAAAGIAAAFNAPIAGCMFALEVILGRFSNRYLGIVVVAAVSANVVSRMLLGDAPAFHVPVYYLNSPLELPLYALMAVLCAIAAIAFIKILYGAEHLFDNWKVPLYVRTAVGMGLTGVAALFAPQILGAGLEFIGDTIADDVTITIGLMVVLLLLKLLATTFTLGAGNSGGVFAPALFMGAMVGGIVGQFGHVLWPETVISPGAFALVGMAALFAGAARSPITAIVIVLEMSNDYRLILPLLMAVVITTILTDVLHPDTIYTLKLRLKGIHLSQEQDVDVLQEVQVQDIMQSNYQTVKPDMLLPDLLPLLTMSHHHGFPIVDENKHLVGIITLTDIERIRHREQDMSELTAADVGTTRRVVTVFPDDAVHIAMSRLNLYNIGRLPVVSRMNGDKYMGMVRRVDILKAYDIGIARKAVRQQRDKFFKLRDIDQHEFIDVYVESESPMVGKTLQDFPCSEECLVVAVHRGGSTLMAHGDTIIQSGDRVTAYVLAENEQEVIAQFKDGLEDKTSSE